MAYQHYVVANWNYLIYGDREGWNDLPLLEWRYVLSVLFYTLTPVFLGAMIALSMAAREKNVSRAVSSIKQEHEKLTEQIRPYVQAKVSEPRVQAYLDLRRLLEKYSS